MNQPLQGLTVVAMEQAVAAPLCTARLVDSGARVIKLEREVGDFARGYDTAAAGDSSYFAWLNHGKESVTLNYKHAEDLALLHRLLAKADVFVQNLAPGVLSRHGLDDDKLRRLYPRLITCNLSGYGASADVKHLKAYDLLVQAESGLLSVSGVPGNPGRIGVSLCDIGCGVTAYGAVLEALIQRGITGIGSRVDVSLFDVAAEWMSVPLIHAETGNGAPSPSGLHHPSIAPYGAYKSADGALTLLSIQNEAEWARLCSVTFNRPEWVDDPRFASNVTRVENRTQLDDLMQDIVSQWQAVTFRDRLRQADIAFGAMNSVEELAAHVGLRRRTVRASSGQMLSLPAHPFKHHVSRSEEAPTVPQAGQHTNAIKAEFTSD